MYCSSTNARASPSRSRVALPAAPEVAAPSPATSPAAAPARLSLSVPGGAGLALVALLLGAAVYRGARLLAAFRREGLIAVFYGRIEVRDPRGLDRIAGS